MKRYGFDAFDDLVERDEGQWVRYVEAQSLQAENDRLNAEATSDAELIKRLNASLAEAREDRLKFREALLKIYRVTSCRVLKHESLYDIARKALEGEGK